MKICVYLRLWLWGNEGNHPPNGRSRPDNVTGNSPSACKEVAKLAVAPPLLSAHVAKTFCPPRGVRGRVSDSHTHHRLQEGKQHVQVSLHSRHTIGNTEWTDE